MIHKQTLYTVSCSRCREFLCETDGANADGFLDKESAHEALATAEWAVIDDEEYCSDCAKIVADSKA